MDFGFPAMLVLLLLAADRDFLLLTLSVCILHECGHGLAMCLTGAGLREIQLTAAGLQLRTGTSVLSKGKLLCIYLSGPLTNLVFAAIFHQISTEIALLHLVLGLFNLLPFRVLDGGAALEMLQNPEPIRLWLCAGVWVVMLFALVLHSIRNPLLYLMLLYLAISEWMHKKLPTVP